MAVMAESARRSSARHRARSGRGAQRSAGLRSIYGVRLVGRAILSRRLPTLAGQANRPASSKDKRGLRGHTDSGLP